MVFSDFLAIYEINSILKNIYISSISKKHNFYISSKKLNDAEDGCTVFLTNIPFSVDNDQLKALAESAGPVRYALVCVDRLTEHSKGSGFIKFVVRTKSYLLIRA